MSRRLLLVLLALLFVSPCNPRPPEPVYVPPPTRAQQPPPFGHDCPFMADWCKERMVWDI